MTDPEGKIFFADYLKSKGFDIVNFGTNYSCYDIEATYNGETYFFELKKRNNSSTDWGDSIIEKGKYDKALTKLSSSKTAKFIEPAIPLFPLEKDLASGLPNVKTGLFSLSTAHDICCNSPTT